MGVAQLSTFPLLDQAMVKGYEISNIFGNIIRKHRMSRGLSQEKLAELGDIERSYISKIENGERAIQIVTFIRFANALDIKASVLMVELEKQLDGSVI